jgi:hypothetical protein
MVDSDDIKLKNEINGIMGRVEEIMTIIEELDPAKNEDSTQDEDQTTGVIKIAHSMALKNIPYLFLPVYLVSGFRCQPRRRRSRINQTRNLKFHTRFQRLCSSFLTPDT